MRKKTNGEDERNIKNEGSNCDIPSKECIR